MLAGGGGGAAVPALLLQAAAAGTSDESRDSILSATGSLLAGKAGRDKVRGRGQVRAGSVSRCVPGLVNRNYVTSDDSEPGLLTCERTQRLMLPV